MIGVTSHAKGRAAARFSWADATEALRDTTDMPAKAKRGKAPMSAAHKEALAVGREEGRAVRRYLEALEAHKPKRGRKRSAETIQKRLDQIEEVVFTENPPPASHPLIEVPEKSQLRASRRCGVPAFGEMIGERVKMRAKDS